MNEEIAVGAFGALSNASRLQVLKLLVQAGPTGLTAGAIAQGLGASPSRASFHLAALAEAGLLTAERVSRQIIYRVDFAVIGAIVGYLLHDCCQGQVRADAPDNNQAGATKPAQGGPCC
jgi:DNA-binding transcriptional ArsR family regulator